MLTHFSISNFKSIKSLNIDFEENLSLLIGLNGSGKSTILQAIDFVVSMTKYRNNEDWFTQRGWTKDGINRKLASLGKNIEFELRLKTQDGIEYEWACIYSKIDNVITQEILYRNGVNFFWADSGKGKYSLDDNTKDIDFSYTGSILSVLKLDKYSSIGKFVEELNKIYSIELLSPNQIRRRTKEHFGGIGLGGEALAPMLYSIKDEKRQELKRIMRQFYPDFEDYSITKVQGGGKKLIIHSGGMRLESSHVNDGMLRVLALMTQILSDSGVVLVDEIENGLNPELLELIIEELQKSKTQIIATTHSPLVLNFLPDEKAKKGVKFVFTDERRNCNVKNFFDIPSAKNKLGLLGAGEVMLTVSMNEMAQEARAAVSNAK